MKKILVPTDFSSTSAQALAFAVEIAKKAKAEITLLHVLDMPAYLADGAMTVPSSPTLNEFVADFKNDSEKGLAKAAKKAAYAKIKTVSEAGIPNDVIVNKAKGIKADLIVMGTKGASGVAEWMVGSNAEKVVRFANCPVLSVNKKPRNFSLQNIVLASDFSGDKYNNLETLSKLAKVFNAKIHLLKVHTQQYFEETIPVQKKMKKFADSNKLQNYTLNQLNSFKIERGIFEFAKEVKADVIAMGTHRRKGIAHLFMGSRAEEIVNHSLIPILTVKVVKK